jgi:hypothetical protein
MFHVKQKPVEAGFILNISPPFVLRGISSFPLFAAYFSTAAGCLSATDEFAVKELFIKVKQMSLAFGLEFLPNRCFYLPNPLFIPLREV